MKTITFERGRIIVRGGGMPVIEPCDETISAEELNEILTRHGFKHDEGRLKGVARLNDDIV